MFRLNTPLNFDSLKSIFGDKKKEDDSKYVLPSDKPTKTEAEDIFLRNKKIAKNISHAIRNSLGQMNFLISGDWGMGKTSILYSIDLSPIK